MKILFSRGAIVALFSCFAGLASASFEMLLIPFYGDGVMRYDPVNHLEMGTFGADGNNDVIDIPEAQGGFALVQREDGLFKYNYSTGDLVATMPGGATGREVLGLGNGKYWSVGVNGGINQYNFASPTAATAISVPNGFFPHQVIRTDAANGMIYTIGKDTSGSLVGLNFNSLTNTFVGSPTLLVASTDVLVNSITGASVRSVRAGTGQAFLQIPYLGIGGAQRVIEIEVNPTSGTVLSMNTLANPLGLPSVTFQDVFHFYRGHGTTHGYGWSTQGYGLTHFQPGTLNPLSTHIFTSGGYTLSPNQMSLVIAPEPSSLACLVFGAFAVLRNRAKVRA